MNVRDREGHPRVFLELVRELDVRRWGRARAWRWIRYGHASLSGVQLEGRRPKRNASTDLQNDRRPS